jgi:hypothetical protein
MKMNGATAAAVASCTHVACTHVACRTATYSSHSCLGDARCELLCLNPLFAEPYGALTSAELIQFRQNCYCRCHCRTWSTAGHMSAEYE